MRFTFLIVVLVSFNALLHSQEMLYYAEDTFGGSNIYRVNMDGTGKEVVGNTMLPCTAIVADYNRGKLFFSQQDFLTRCNLDGSDPQRVAFNFTHLIYDIKMDFSRNKLYVLTIKQGSSGSLKAVFQIDADASHIAIPDLEPIFTVDYPTTNILPDFTNNCFYYKGYDPNSNETFVKKTNMDGSNTETILVISQPYSRDLELNNSQQRLYWCSGGDICMLDLELGASSFQSVNISRGNLLDLVVDNLHNRLYWTNENPASIQRSDLSLQNIETLVTQFNLYPWQLDVVLKQPFSSVPTMGKYGLFIFAFLFILLALALKKRN